MVNQGAQGGTANFMPTHENKVLRNPDAEDDVDYGKSKGIMCRFETRGGRRGGRGRGAGRGRRRHLRSPWSSAARCGTGPGLPPGRHTAAPARPQTEGGAAGGDSQAAGARSNVDVGAPARQIKEETASVPQELLPTNAGSMHTRVNARGICDGIKFLEHDLGYKGLYTIAGQNGHEGTQPIYDVIVATL